MTREEAITRLKGLYGNGYKKQEQALDMAIQALEQEPKTGHWTECKTHEPTGFFLPTCSECGKIQPYAHHTFSWNFCPSCGAKMVNP